MKIGLEKRTELFNNRFDRLCKATLALRRLTDNFTAHTRAEVEYIRKRNEAIAAAWRTLNRDFADLFAD